MIKVHISVTVPHMCLAVKIPDFFSKSPRPIVHAGLSWECFIGRGRLGLIKRGKEYKLEKCAYFVKLVQHAKRTHCTVNFLNSQFLVLSVSAF